MPPPFFWTGLRAADSPTGMDPSPHPPEDAAAMAYALAESAAQRDIDYEEYTFEIEDGASDGTEIKVLVIRV